MDHTKYMRQALKLAEKGCGFTNPNPMVGAVIVKNGKVIGSGYHEKAGAFHAERNALNACIKSPQDAVMYVTLEPCCHHGRTPPCTDAIIQNGIGTVVIGAEDPNEAVAGKGIKQLREKGIHVITGVLEEECTKLNAAFFHHIRSKTPYVAMKYAMTLDGKIATSAGNSQWITGLSARKHVHKLRHQYTGIMAGVNTVIADDPMLNCRLEGTLNPVRIICDTTLRIPVSSKIVDTAEEIQTCIAYCSGEPEKLEALEKAGCQLIKTPLHEGKTDLTYLMKVLYQQGIDSILLEGGAALNAQALSSHIVQKLYAYIAPKIVGGLTARGPVGGSGIEELEDAVKVVRQDMHILGDDILLECQVEE